MVEVLDLEDGLPELPEVELEDAGHRVDVGGVGHVGQRVVAALEAVTEVVDLHLRSGHAEDPVVVQPVKVDYPHAASDDERDILRYKQIIVRLNCNLKTNLDFGSLRRGESDLHFCDPFLGTSNG